MKNKEYESNNFDEINNYFNNDRKNLKIPLIRDKVDITGKIIKIGLWILLVFALIYLIFKVVEFLENNKLPQTIINNIKNIKNVKYQQPPPPINKEKIKQIEQKLNDNDEKTITDFSFFKTVEFDNYSIITGLKYKTSDDEYPYSQWCYTNIPQNDGSALHITLATKDQKDDIIYKNITNLIATNLKIPLWKLRQLKNNCKFYNY